MDTALTLSTVVVAGLTILGMISRVVGRVIKGITALINETKENTKAVKDVGTKLENNVSPVLTDHESRITKIEGRLSQ